MNTVLGVAMTQAAVHHQGSAAEVTAVCQMLFVPPLRECEEAAKRAGLSIAFFNPHAGAEQPWLWLESGRHLFKVYRAVEDVDLDDCLRACARTARDSTGRYFYGRRGLPKYEIVEVR